MDTQIEDHGACTSELLSRGYYLDSFIRNLIRVHFTRNPLEGFNNIKSLVWLPDERAGGEDVPGTIRIDTLDAWNPSRVDSGPFVIVSAGDMTSIRLGIGDSHMSPHNPDLTGGELRSRAWVGSIAVFCGSRKYLQSRLIAFSVAEYLQNMAKEIARKCNLKRLEVASLKATRPLKEQPTFLVTPVVIEYGFIETWKVLPSAPPLNRFAVTQAVS